jgi:hypothetical protein
VRVGRAAVPNADDGTPSDVAGGYVNAGIACIERTDVQRRSRFVSLCQLSPFRSEPAPKLSVACLFRFLGLAVAVFCFSVAPFGIKLAHDSSILRSGSIAHRLMRRRHAVGKRMPRCRRATTLRGVNRSGGGYVSQLTIEMSTA